MGLIYGFHLLAPFPGTRRCANAAANSASASSPTTGRAYHANRAVTETATVDPADARPIAVEWEDRFNRYLGDIKERMQQGQGHAPTRPTS